MQHGMKTVCLLPFALTGRGKNSPVCAGDYVTSYIINGPLNEAFKNNSAYVYMGIDCKADAFLDSSRGRMRENSGMFCFLGQFS